METLSIQDRRPQYRILLLAIFVLSAVLILSFQAFSQEKDTIPDGTEGVVLVIPPKDSLVNNLPPNEFDGKYSNFKIGMGYILDYVTYSQDDMFKAQMDTANLILDPKWQTRDFRILGSGAFKTKRTLAWKFAYMYDGDDKIWMLRETGLAIGVPELAGHIFIGRTKEGYSMVKVMNGHSPWTGERQMALDVVPILADGIKWMGSLPKPRVFWNLGYYNDVLSEGQGFSTYEWQFSGRVGWLPYYKKEENKVVHVAANVRFGEPVNGQITLKSRPEANPAPQIINTGAFHASNSTHVGAELYYSSGRFMIGSEVMMHSFKSDDFEDHKFYGGDAVLSYFLTSTKRPYTTVSSIFGFVPVTKSVFKGGWGEWEAVLRFSSLDLDDKSVQGGKFWRITPMVNWYMTKIMRMEFIYGYGELDRYNMKGGVQFFQTRIQLTIM